MRQSKPALLFKPEHYTPSEMEKKTVVRKQ